jgi:hypothetical protein
MYVIGNTRTVISFEEVWVKILIQGKYYFRCKSAVLLLQNELQKLLLYVGRTCY